MVAPAVRFVAAEANATNCAVLPATGLDAAAFAGVVPSGVEIRIVEGVQVVVD